MKTDLRTAASITLVLQAVVPAASLSGSSLDLQLEGGTDVPWSPTLDYFATVAVPALKLMGVGCQVEASRRGYYPRGGGRVRARIEPCKRVEALDLTERGANPPTRIVSRCGRLPSHVAERQMRAAKSYLEGQRIEVESSSFSQEASESPGSSILVSAVGRNCYLGSDSIGARGKAAEAVGHEAAEEFAATHRTGASVDEHLSDTLAPFLSLAESDSRILVPHVSEHLKTSLHVAKLFTGCSYDFVTRGKGWLLSISPEKHNL